MALLNKGLCIYKILQTLDFYLKTNVDINKKTNIIY
jgi:hypothetical protein